MPKCLGCQKTYKSLAKHTRTCSLYQDYSSSIQKEWGRSRDLTKRQKIEHEVSEENRAGTSSLQDHNDDEEFEDNEDLMCIDEEDEQHSFLPPDQDQDLDPLQPPMTLTRSGRHHHLPKRYNDYLPHFSESSPPPENLMADSRDKLGPDLDPHLTTETNFYGLYRVYPTTSTNPLVEEVELEELCDSPGLAAPSQQSTDPSSGWRKAFGGISPMSLMKEKIGQPILNATVTRLMSWFYRGTQMKSISDLDVLVNDVILAEDFNRDHLANFSTRIVLEALDNGADLVSNAGLAVPLLPSSSSRHLNPFEKESGWSQATVTIPLPCEDRRYASEADAPKLDISGVWHRKLVDVIKSAFEDADAKSFHYLPFKEFWKPSPSSEPERVYSEIYNSDAFFEEHEKLQAQSPEPNCTLERAIAAMMLWSDSTHLASFGTASLWPIYLLFGNQSKYSRAKPSRFACHHLAYMPTLPQDLQDRYISIFNIAASAGTITHLKRELIHAIWLLLMDEDFMHAYEHGIIVKCADGVTRRLYPRFFTYSADYPEKVLIATIKFLGRCPCPRCLIRKDKINGLGSNTDEFIRQYQARDDNKTRRDKIDLARRKIFQSGAKVNGNRVEKILKVHSLTPTQNAFSIRLSKFGFNLFKMLSPDEMHEFDSGVWKASFTHLLRLLYALGGDAIQKLNQRYRKVPTFGNSTIRRFSNNASGMKKLAARDFENLLKCSIPVFEGLFPEEHNRIVMDLLFTLCTWHGLAKLRLHTNSTLAALREATRVLGDIFREFAEKTCMEYDTRELPQEEAARGRRQAALAKKAAIVETGVDAATQQQPAALPRRRRRKEFNLSTYKLHALGDYVSYIQLFGTSDNYSTQTGELEHRRVKRFYARTNKRSTFVQQIGKHKRWERAIRRLLRGLPGPGSAGSDSSPTTDRKPRRRNIPKARATVSFTEDEPLPPTLPQMHHHISVGQRHVEYIGEWLANYCNDPSVQDFLPLLKNHLLSRLLGHAYDGDEHIYSEQARSRVHIINHRMYRHKVLRVNYTTYDMRRAQDSINPRTHSDIMLLARETPDGGSVPHPYWYARVLGIFHVNVRFSGIDAESSGPLSYTEPIRMDFLWIRWLARLDAGNSPWSARRLHKVGFVQESDQTATYGFLDPSEVIRSIHLIPTFADNDKLEEAGIGLDSDEDKDTFYVNMFADRDMMMRFRGGGIGHKFLHETFSPPVPAEYSLSPAHAINIKGDHTRLNTIDEEDSEGSCGDLDDPGQEGEDEAEDEDEEDSIRGDEDEDDDTLGPEDGEEGYAEDEMEAYGYAPF